MSPFRVTYGSFMLLLKFSNCLHCYDKRSELPGSDIGYQKSAFTNGCIMHLVRQSRTEQIWTLRMTNVGNSQCRQLFPVQTTGTLMPVHAGTRKQV